MFVGRKKRDDGGNERGPVNAGQVITAQTATGVVARIAGAAELSPRSSSHPEMPMSERSSSCCGFRWWLRLSYPEEARHNDRQCDPPRTALIAFGLALEIPFYSRAALLLLPPTSDASAAPLLLAT